MSRSTWVLCGACIAFLILLLVLLNTITVTPALGLAAPSPTPPDTRSGAGMSDPTQWMSPPPNGPSQVDKGAFTYWMRCMVCHGDRGQGLALFRASYPKVDQNCSSSKCHGGPRPGAGFSFPDAPAIEGTGTLARFKTARELYDFISTRMPYQAPAALSPDEYWSLVAYLLEQRGTLPAGIQVDARNAGGLAIHTTPAPTSSGQLGIAIAAAALALAVLGFVWVKYLRS